jgi:hypothetical protein
MCAAKDDDSSNVAGIKNKKEAVSKVGSLFLFFSFWDGFIHIEAV